MKNGDQMKSNKNIVKLPHYEVKRVVSVLSQATDWGLLNLNIPATWTESTGKDIVVLIIDTGCPVTRKDDKLIIHPDLVGAIDIDKCKSFIRSEDIEDFQGHSSHCCGIVGARNNDIGCVGYAPDCTIVTYKGLDKSGSGDMNQITNALIYAADVLKPDLISMSLGSPASDEKLHAAIKRLYDMNIPIIAAGGNGGEDEGVNYPGEYDETVTIGAYDMNDNIADFSAVGDGMDFAFPGVEIYSTYLNGRYAKLSGTCLKGNTLIYTTKGPKHIIDMQKGDVVYCLDEKNLNIIEDECVNLIDNGYKQLFKIITDHNTIYATDNHPFFVLSKIVVSNGIRKRYKREFIWKPLKDLNKNDLICTFKQINNSGTAENINNLLLNKHNETKKLFKQITLQTQIPNKPLKITKDLCQFIGAYLGDGYVHHDTRNINGFTGIGLCIRRGYKQTNIDLPLKYKKIFDESVGLTITERESGDLFIYSTYLANIFNEIGLGGDAHQKRIPSWCFELSSEYKAAIISGIIDSDGWITKRGNMGLQLCNLPLLQDIKIMLEILGVKCSNIKQRTTIGHSFNKENPKIYTSYYFVSTQIKKISNLLCFFDCEYQKRINKKRIFEKHNFNYCSNIEKTIKNTQICFEKIRHIDIESIEKVYDITIKNNHNFIADGLVVHNSMATPAAAGVVALLLAKHKKQEKETGKNDCKTVDQIKEHLKKYSIDKGPAGKDKQFGWGIVDVSKMILTPESINDPIIPIQPPAPPPIEAEKTKWQKIIDWFKEIFWKI